MKKIISILCAITMLTASVTAFAAAEDKERETAPSMIRISAEEEKDTGSLKITPGSGECGAKLKWKLEENGTLTISGTGDMTDYFRDDTHSPDIPWYKDNNPRAVKRVIVEEGVTSISSMAFYGMSITSLTLPKSVKKVGKSFASNCPALTHVSLPDGIETLTEGAFNSDPVLETVIMPSKLKTIEEQVFLNCFKLKNIILPKTLTEIRLNSFSRCNSLETVVIPKGVKTIGECAFDGCPSLKTVIFQKGLEEIEDNAFANSSNIEKVILPDGVKKIGGYAFSFMDSERDRSLPEMEIYVPKTVKAIGKNGIDETAIISGFKNTTAQTYAKNNKNEFNTVTKSLFDTTNNSAAIKEYYAQEFTMPKETEPTPAPTAAPTDKPKSASGVVTVRKQTFTDMEDSQKAALLSRLGIISGYEDGTFRPEGEVTRAEAATIVARMANREEDIESFSENAGGYGDNNGILESFADYDPSFWANMYIRAGILNGAIAGFEDNTFRPEEKVTTAQILKMLVCSLGYEYYAEMSGGYPAGYIAYAEKLGITNGAQNTEPSKNATRGDILTYVGNAVSAPVVMITGYETGYWGEIQAVYEKKDGRGEDYQSILTYIYDVYTAEANVTDNGDIIKADILSSVNFNEKEITEDDKLSVELKTNKDSAGDVTGKGKYKMFIKLSDYDKEEYELVYGIKLQ